MKKITVNFVLFFVFLLCSGVSLPASAQIRSNTYVKAIGDKYEGFFSAQGGLHGIGIIIKPDGRRYEAEFDNNRLVRVFNDFSHAPALSPLQGGQKVQYGDDKYLVMDKPFRNGQYKGDIKDNLAHGLGAVSNKTGSRQFVGEFRNGWLHKGVYRTRTRLYEGEFSNGSFNGRGKISYDMTELSFIGDFKDDAMVGKGTMFAFDRRCEGVLRNDSLWGPGVCYFDNGDILECAFSEGAPDGLAFLTKPSGQMYKAEYHKGGQLGEWVQTAEKNTSKEDLSGLSLLRVGPFPGLDGQGEYYGYLDDTGRMRIKPKWHNDDAPQYFAPNVASSLVLQDRGLWGFRSRTGEWTIPPTRKIEYSTKSKASVLFPVSGFNEQGLACVRSGGYWGFINTSGEWAIPPQFEDEILFGFARGPGKFGKNGLALVKKNGKYGYINAKGEMVIPPQFEYASDFADNGLAGAGYKVSVSGSIGSDGKIAVQQFGHLDAEEVRRGYINSSGEWVIPRQFISAGDFSDGLAKVSKFMEGKPKTLENIKHFFINERGQVALTTDALGFKDGLANTSDKRGNYYIIDTSGKKVFEHNYGTLVEFYCGLAIVGDDKKGYGAIDKKGNIVIPFEESVLSDNAKYGNGTLILRRDKRNKKNIYYNRAGEVVFVVQKECGINVGRDINKKVIWPPEDVLTSICDKAK